jgi:aryl-alcohol dehydrogenase-like predicted oxidoreductase
MNRRGFPKRGWQWSEIGYGAWGIGGSWWGKAVDDQEALAALREAVTQGINFFDTALVYGQGHSESLIGQILRENKNQKHYVASNIPPKNGRWPADHKVPAGEVFPAAWVKGSTEKSLASLGIEKIDLMQFHVWSDEWLTQDEWKRAVEDLKKEGKIDAFGVSINDHEPDSALKLVASGLADSVQVIFNLFDQSPRERLLPLCAQHQVAVIARVPFDEGSLTGAFSKDTAFDDADFRKDYFAGRMDEVLKRVAGLSFLLDGKIDTLALAALNFVLSFPEVTTVIPGMRKARHVAQNVRASALPRFSAATLEKLKAHAWVRNFYHN